MTSVVAMAPAATPRWQKVSAEGLLLSRDATDWVACYDAALQLTVSRHPLSCGEVTWKQAQAAATESQLCGFDDWTCGTRQQWASIIDDDHFDPAIDPEVFSLDNRFEWVWTSTPAAPSGYAWVVYLNDGDSFRYNQAFHDHVRAVRAGQLLDLGQIP